MIAVPDIVRRQTTLQQIALSSGSHNPSFPPLSQCSLSLKHGSFLGDVWGLKLCILINCGFLLWSLSVSKMSFLDEGLRLDFSVDIRVFFRLLLEIMLV